MYKKVPILKLSQKFHLTVVTLAVGNGMCIWSVMSGKQAFVQSFANHKQIPPFYKIVKVGKSAYGKIHIDFGSNCKSVHLIGHSLLLEPVGIAGLFALLRSSGCSAEPMQHFSDQ